MEPLVPGAVLAVEEDQRPVPALTPQSPPGHGPDPLVLAPVAACAPTLDHGLHIHSHSLDDRINICVYE